MSFVFLSVMTKSGPMGEWRKAKTEVSQRFNEIGLISIDSEEIRRRIIHDSVFQDITSRNE